MDQIILQAPAKINPILRIMGRRENAYHELEMLMVPLALSDELTLSRSEQITLECDHVANEGMNAESNLAWQAAKLLQEETGCKSGVHIQLKKRIPVAAGLGGGSSDAASTLLGLNQLWELDLELDQLVSYASRLGSDVPFFCYQAPALVGGLGEIVSPLTDFPKLSILLINPGISVSSSWAYQAYDETLGKSGQVWGKSGDFQLTAHGGSDSYSRLFKTRFEIEKLLRNDLEEPVLAEHPEISEVKDFLKACGASSVLMSGSGSTVFGIFATQAARDEAAASKLKSNWLKFATETAG